jgi:hypothetical protein
MTNLSTYLTNTFDNWSLKMIESTYMDGCMKLEATGHLICGYVIKKTRGTNKQNAKYVDLE